MREAWLSILTTRRGERTYSASFSNTPAAHTYGRTRDWVVLRADGPFGKYHCTLVTARRGWLRGKRIVRSRESECARHYLRRSRSDFSGRN
jgi:hypothetical protein